jgi:hypothetical protein
MAVFNFVRHTFTLHERISSYELFIRPRQIRRKKQALASAETIKQTDEELERKVSSSGRRDQEASCFKLQNEETCPTFRGKRSGGQQV